MERAAACAPDAGKDARMTATLAVEPRRPEGTGTSPPREMPVLFHLMDVSRPQSNTTLAAAPRGSAPSSVISEPESGLDQIPATTTPFSSPAASGPLVAAESPEKPEAAEVAPSNLSIPPVESKPTTPAAEAANTIAEPSKPSPAQAPSPRSKAEERRKAKSSARGDWFTRQGKYIAIGFMLALAATIYVARSGKQATKPAAAKNTQAHPGEAVNQVAASSARPATVVGEAKPATKTGSGGTSEASPARLAEAPKPEAAPQVDLHPPTIPQLASEPPEGQRRADEGLFPWATREDERIATRPDPPQPSDPQIAPSNQPFNGPPTGPPPTAAPDGGSQPEQPYYPTTGYQGQYHPAVAPPPQISPPGPELGPPAGGPPPQYTPQDNSARGYRYERTGSGLY